MFIDSEKMQLKRKELITIFLKFNGEMSDWLQFMIGCLKIDFQLRFQIFQK